MQNKTHSFLAFVISFGLVAFAHTVSAEETSLDNLKEELRTQYKDDLANYKALDDKSLETAKDMRQKLVNMGIEAKKIRDLMKEISSTSEESEITELREQMESHISAFRQDHGEFSNIYAEYSQPAEESALDAEPVLEVAEDMSDELKLEEGQRDVAEETAEPEKFEKIVIAEDMSQDEEEDEFESDFE